jgi:hypothetical protein
VNDKKKYQITVGATTRQVYPINDKDVVYTFAREDDHIFYGKKLKNKLVFHNNAKATIDDYSFFYGYESNPALRCETFYLEIFKLCEGEYVTEFKGKFSLNDGDWDLDKCTFAVKPEPNDIYACIKANKKNEVNILDVLSVVTTSAQLAYNYEFYYCIGAGAPYAGACAPPGPNASEWALLHRFQNYTYYDEDCVLQTINVTIYYREFVVTTCVAGAPNYPSTGSGWALEDDNCTLNGTAKYVRTPTITYSLISSNENPNVVSSNCDDTPPQKTCLEVTKTATPNTVTIVGFSAVDIATQTTGKYLVEEIPGATYTWSITGSGNTIDAGNGTNVIDVTFNNSGTVSVAILTVCGNTINASLPFVVTVGGTNNVVNGIELSGRTRVCPGSKARFKFNYNPGTSMIATVLTGTPTIVGNTTISSSPDYEFELEFGNDEGAIQLSFAPSASTSVDNAPGITVVVSRAAATPTIKGYTDVCNSGEYYYEVPAMDTVTNYAWTVSGGTITATANPNRIKVTWDGNNGPEIITLKETIGCACSLILITDYLSGLPSCPRFWLCPKTDTNVIFDRNRPFQDVCEYVVDALGCGVDNVVSDFFDWNAIGDAPGYTAGINYVTTAANKLTRMTIAQKSDIINPTSSGAATKGMITFEKLEKIWRELFNAYWFIDANDNLRIEHISYFQKTVGYDTTISPNAIYNIAKRKYSYDKSKMPKVERFKFSEALQTDMVGADIWYDSICVDQDSDSNVKERGTADFLTCDLYNIFQNPGDINKQGFVLMANTFDGVNYQVDSEQGKISNLIIQNGHLSWANLHHNYHKYNRVLLQGYMNLVVTNFITAIKAKKQSEIVIQLCCDEEFEPSNYLVKTDLGDGIVDEADYSTRSNRVSATILHT